MKSYLYEIVTNMLVTNNYFAVDPLTAEWRSGSVLGP